MINKKETLKNDDVLDESNFSPELTVLSPGRINIIGEHTDYNEGFVLPTAIKRNITFKFRKNDSENQCTIYSADYDKYLKIDLTKIERSDQEWKNYFLGVINEILKRTNKLFGFECIIKSTLPSGAGLSSSAALECGFAYGLNHLFDLGLTQQDIIELSVEAEHSYVGTQCGIMDQFASVMSKEGHLILLDCKTIDYKLIPFNIDPYKILMLNTNVKHSLASSEYNDRRSECSQGTEIIKQSYQNVNSLRDVDFIMLENCKNLMPPKIYDRCLFVLEENSRVHLAIDSLTNKNIEALGELLYQSHKGLSLLYEVSCPELDFLIDFSKDFDSVIGARMMGGGFGGCTLNLIHEKDVDDYKNKAIEAYKNKFGIDLTAFIVEPSGGTKILR